MKKTSLFYVLKAVVVDKELNMDKITKTCN